MSLPAPPAFANYRSKYLSEINALLEKVEAKQWSAERMDRQQAAATVAHAIRGSRNPIVFEILRDDLVNRTAYEAVKSWIDPKNGLFLFYPEEILQISKALLK